VSAPIAFVALGVLVANGPTAVVHVAIGSTTLRGIAEVTLAVVLFTDAARVNVHDLRHSVGLPARLLGIGLPLTMAAGAAAAYFVVPGLGWWLAALVAAIVAPTDAALGATIVQDPDVPGAIRRLLNVESGLNDGIVAPFVELFLAGALSAQATLHAGITSAVQEIAIGLGVGIGAGLVGGVLLRASLRRKWANPVYAALAVAALALVAYAATIEAGGNGFVAAFVAGMAFGTVMGDELAQTSRFASNAGELLSLLVWLAFGAVVVVPGLKHATMADVGFAVLALTVVRMVPVALSLLGTHLHGWTVAFVGWFGPRGLASVVFGLIAFDALPAARADHVIGIVTVTITLSVVAHGITAAPLGHRYGRWVATLAPDRPEHATPPRFTTRSMHRRSAALPREG
jgi:sodium/hydrogen antiporter